MTGATATNIFLDAALALAKATRSNNWIRWMAVV